MHRPVFLTGMMGSGKTTVGRVVAHDRQGPFVDLDARIVRLFGATVPELFTQGESRFRECERQALRSLLAEPGFSGRHVVVATGGGVVLDPENRRAMASAGIVVYLEVGLDTLVQRLVGQLRDQPEARPLLGGEVGLRGRLAELLACRRAAYHDCDVCVDGEGPAALVAARVRAAVDDELMVPDSEAV